MTNDIDFVFNKYGVKFTYLFRKDQMEKVIKKLKVHFNTKVISYPWLPFPFPTFPLRPIFLLYRGNIRNRYAKR